MSEFPRQMTWDWPQDPTVAEIVTVLSCSLTPEGVATWLYAQRAGLSDARGRCKLYAEAVRMAEGVFA